MTEASRTLKVLQVVPGMESGGVERGVMEIHHALIAGGHQSFCVSSGGRLIPQLENSGGIHFDLPVHSKNPFKIIKNSRRIEEIILTQGIDVLHVRSRAPAWSCLFACRKTGIPMVTTFHGQYGAQNQLKRLYNSAMLRGDLTIAVSDFIAQHIVETYAVPSDRITTIKRGVDSNEFNPEQVSTEQRQRVLKQWGMTEQQIQGKQVILLPARLTRLKGHETLIQALYRLDDPNILAICVGSSTGREKYRFEMEFLRDSLNLRSQVLFKPNCDDMVAAYSLADLVVSASTKPESFGRTLCEAQAMGRRVVASAHGGALETLCQVQRKGLFQPGNARDLARSISIQLAHSPTEIENIAQQSRSYIQSHFSLKNMCDQTLANYQSVIAARSVSPASHSR